MNISKLVAGGVVVLAVAIVCFILYVMAVKPNQQMMQPFDPENRQIDDGRFSNYPENRQIDDGRFSDYPMNWELTTFVEVGKNRQLNLIHKVTYDVKSSNYMYYYRVELQGEGSVLLQWDVLDQMLGHGPNLFEINHGVAYGVREFSMKTKAPATLLNGRLRWFVRKDGKEKSWSFGGESVSRGPIAPMER